MTDQELVLAALRQVGSIVGEHLELGMSDADEAIRSIGRGAGYEGTSLRDQPARARIWAEGGEVAIGAMFVGCHEPGSDSSRQPGHDRCTGLRRP
jgi:hypothetical protein